MSSRNVSRVVIGAAVAALSIGSVAQAALVPSSSLSPYTGTGGAAYLYHLDSSTDNSGSAGATGNLGAASGSYVGSSLNSNFNNALSGTSPGSVSGDDAVALRSMTDAAGSFTVEAIVNVPVAPQNFFIANYGGESETAPNSVNGSWYLTYNDGDTGNGRLQFVIRNRNRNAAGAWLGADNIVNSLPGVTLAVGESYHIAATWDNPTAAYALYVTQLTGAGANNQGQALLLASGNGSNTAWGLNGKNYQLGVGAVASGDGGNGDPGTITSSILDEVRISAGVLAPNQFTVLQAIPEPASLGLMGLGALALMGRKRAR